MSAPLWVRELADAFWQAAGEEEEHYPRDVRRAMVLALPLTRISLPGLSVVEVDGWLRRQGIACGLRSPERPLRACLVAHGSHGAVFLDREDPDDEQRFSLAHELAHFLHDFWQPRMEAVERYGPEVLEVFDGKRPPRPDERIHALLARIPIGFHVHLMDRDQNGTIADPSIDRAEQDADRLAFELLAPEDKVLAQIEQIPKIERREAARSLLQEPYGLPAVPARRYAALLMPEHAPSFTQRLWAVR